MWASEHTGRRHLYLVPVPASGAPPVSRESWVALTARDELVVEDGRVWVDEARRVVYFLATHGSPLEVHVFAVSYGGGNPVLRQLTWPGFSYSGVVFSDNFSMFAASYSSLHALPKASVFALDYTGALPYLSPRTSLFFRCDFFEVCTQNAGDQ